jgi:AcrR family transcriptional regulator
VTAASSRSKATVATATDKKSADHPGSARSRAGDPPSSRRRGAVLELAIFDAVLEQMNCVGFAALTMERVAAAARTGKAALYRRWPCKEDLVADTLDHALPTFDLPPDTGSVRADLAAVFGQMTDAMATPVGCAMQSLLGDLEPGHEFSAILHERVLAPRKAVMLEILRRGVERGDVRPEASTAVVADVGPALLVHRLLTFGPPIDPEYVAAVLDEVVMPLIQSMTPQPQPRRPKT